MDLTTLDTALVQDLQRAYRNGRPITEVIANLNRASLAAIMEYGCLRWAIPEAFPPLPSTIIQSSIGRSLVEVRSELGLRETGPQKIPPKDTSPGEAEFYVVAGEEDILENRYFGEYLVRFEFSVNRSGFPRRTAVALQAGLEEMAANVVNHAKTPVPALIGYQVTGSVAQFCVVDVGRGVLQSLRENPIFAESCASFRGYPDSPSQWS